MSDLADGAAKLNRKDPAIGEIAGYRRPYFKSQPEYLYPPYKSTVKRSPTRPLVLLPHTLSEVTGPVFGFDEVKPEDADLTRQHDGMLYLMGLLHCSGEFRVWPPAPAAGASVSRK